MDKPRGMLMTGAIGSIFMAIAWAIFVTMIAAIMSMVLGGGMGPTSGDTDLFGGIMLLALVLLLAGGFMQGIGFFGLKKMYGGLFSLAGLLTILISICLIAVVVGGIARMLEIAQYASYGLIFSMILGGLFGGLGFLAAKGRATSGGGALVFGGALLTIGALAFIILMVLGLLKVGLPEIVVQILGYAAVGGMLLGHIGATLAMFSQRS